MEAIKNNIVWLLLALLLLTNLSNIVDIFNLNPPEVTVKETVKIVRDPIRVEHTQVVYKEPIVTNNVRTIRVPSFRLPNLPISEPYERDSISIPMNVRLYKDSISIGKAGLKYEIPVIGRLDEGLKFNLFYDQETKYITKEITKTQDRLFDLFLVGDVSADVGSVGIGLEVVAKKWKLGVLARRYEDEMIGQSPYHINFGYRLFGVR